MGHSSYGTVVYHTVYSFARLVGASGDSTEKEESRMLSSTVNRGRSHPRDGSDGMRPRKTLPGPFLVVPELHYSRLKELN